MKLFGQGPVAGKRQSPDLSCFLIMKVPVTVLNFKIKNYSQ